jgi:transposase-like protein
LGSAVHAGDRKAFAVALASPPQSTSWVDETYVKVRGKWAYLYRALDKEGNTIEVRQNTTF